MNYPAASGRGICTTSHVIARSEIPRLARDKLRNLDLSLRGGWSEATDDEAISGKP